MIKFIATDLDGTLLPADKQLPEEIFGLIERLHRKGVLFAPASGRQYANLRKLFEPVADKVVFICENGALVKYREETLQLFPIPDAQLRSAIGAIRALPHVFPMLCGEKCAYIEDSVQPFYRYSMEAYTVCKLVPSLDDVIGRELICKIAVYDEIAAAENCIKHLPAAIPALRTVLSGFDWCDVSSPEANKGSAVRAIRKIFGLKREECAAFGDHMNDYEMLSECGSAFVAESGYPPLIRLIGRTVPSPEEGGVLRKLKEFLETDTL